jgi:hypothetical protein
MIGSRKKTETAPIENLLERNLIPFLSSNYQTINVARLQHLDSLNLPISYKSVVDLGAGIGDHTLYYLIKNCSVMPVEGRKDLADFISSRFGIKSIQMDFEKECKKVSLIGIFDIIHCYGLLYHLANPTAFLSQLGSIGRLLVLESCVSRDDSPDPINLISEDRNNPTQAISGTGCRPTRTWVVSQLKKHFPYVYFPVTQPKNNQFPISWNDSLPSDQNHRAVFIASKERIVNPKLTEEFITIYEKW